MNEYGFLHFPAEAVHIDQARIARLPDSARRIFRVIRDEGPLSHADLKESTGMPPRTIRFAVKRLRDEGLVDARVSLKDCRTCLFFVSKDLIDEAALDDARHRAEVDAEVHHRLIEQA